MFRKENFTCQEYKWVTEYKTQQVFKEEKPQKIASY